MFCFKSDIIYFTLLCGLGIVRCVKKAAAMGDNDLAIAEVAIRGTFNSLFNTFQIRNVAHNPKLKKFSLIHNVFVSMTLNDGKNLKKITKLSRIYNITNNTQYFMTQINESFNDGDKSYEVTDDKYVDSHIVKFIKKLGDLHKTYTLNRNFASYSINENLLKHLNDSELTNVTSNNNGEIWKPTDQSARRIYQGHRTRIKHYPFVVSVHFFERFQCAGSIIEKDLVITAASCLQLAWNNRFFRENPAFLSVQVGSNFYEASGEILQVYEIYFHPEYTPKTLSNNIAIMRLKRHLKFTKRQKRIKKIEFDRNPSPLSVNINGIVILGWGAKDRTNIVYDPWINKLSYAELNYYSLKDCQDIYSKEYVTHKNFCAGFFSKAGGACQNDIGGPGISGGILVGVVSFGPPQCGTLEAPTVFTKVGFYADWIDEIMDLPTPVIHVKTTLQQPKTTRSHYYTDLTTKKRNLYHPIDEGDEEFIGYDDDVEVTDTRMLRKKDLRILGDEQLFKEFLTTMFETNDYSDNSESFDDETTERETTHLHKSIVTTTSKTTSTLPLLDRSDLNAEIVQEKTNTRKGPESIKPHTIASEMEPNYIKVTKIMPLLFYQDHVSNTKSTQEKIKPIDRDSSVDQSMDENDDSNIEKDIVELLNDLDIHKILASDDNSISDSQQNIRLRVQDENVSNEMEVRENPKEYEYELVSYSSGESFSEDDDTLGLIFE